jgi:hypothetical protein
MKLGPLQIQPQRIAIFIGIAIVLLFIMDFNSRMEELARLQNEAATVRAQATGVMVTQYALMTQQAYATSPAAVEEWAREQARMAQPGDKVIVPLPAPNTTPAPTPTPEPRFADLTKWDVWVAIFFGK